MESNKQVTRDDLWRATLVAVTSVIIANATLTFVMLRLLVCS